MYDKILRGNPKMLSFIQFSQNIDGFIQKRFTRLLEFIKLYKQKPLEKFVIFTIDQNYTLTLKVLG